MRLLFVEAIDIDATNKAFESASEPVGLLSLASFIRSRQDHIDIRIVDRDVSGEIDRFSPDIVAIGFVTINYEIARNHARIAHGKGIKVVGGGAHVSAAPLTLPEEMDIGVIGEGELTLLELLQLFPGHRWENKEELSGVKGIVYRDSSGRTVTTPSRPPIEDIDVLPIPARDLFGGRQHGITTSRGCPYKCTFCFSAHLQKKMRYRSPESVVEEIKILVKDFGAKHISIYDDLFISPEKRFNRIVELLLREGIPNHVGFSCNVRPNNVTPQIARNLSRMNVASVFLGIESGVQSVLSYLKPSAATVEQNEKAIRILNEQGILTSGGIIIGSPDETEEDILRTLDWVRRSELDNFEILLLTPLPGTEVWKEALSRGLVSEDMEWGKLDLRVDELSGYTPIVMSKTIAWPRLKELYDQFLAERRRKEAEGARMRLYKFLKSLALNPIRIPYKLFSVSAYKTGIKLLFGKA